MLGSQRLPQVRDGALQALQHTAQEASWELLKPRLKHVSCCLPAQLGSMLGSKPPHPALQKQSWLMWGCWQL